MKTSLSSFRPFSYLVVLAVPILLSSCSFLDPAATSGVFRCHDAKPGAVAQSAVPQVAAELPEPQWDITPEVEFELHQLLGRERYFVAQSLERRDRYLTIMEQIFKDEGVPRSLISLALIESGYNPDARSSAGAVGMWQFIRSTGKIYGLRVDRRHDERRDPILSSIAAARHLKDLYGIYSDWNLALAAYNAGPGGISRALARAGVDDYWSLVRRRKITVQTARYVPRIIAATLIMKNLAKYDLSTLAGNFDWIQEEKNDAMQVASWTGNRRPSAG